MFNGRECLIWHNWYPSSQTQPYWIWKPPCLPTNKHRDPFSIG